MLGRDLFELILSVFFFGLNLTSLIWRLIKDDRKYAILEFGIWGVILELAYYAFFLTTGFSNLINKATDNKCQKFLKNSIFKFIFPFSINSALVFFLGYYLGWITFNTDNSTSDFWLIIFVYLIPSLVVLLDLIIFKRQYQRKKLFDFIIITAIYVIYCILLGSIKPKIKIYVFLYPIWFGLKSNASYIISVMILCYFAYLTMYFVYYYIIKIKSMFSNNSKIDIEDVSKNNDNNQMTLV